MRKNVAGQIVGAEMVDATTGGAFTGAVTAYVTLDGGVQAIGTVGGGACTHEGNGYHTYAPSQAETNGDLLAYTFIGAGAVPATLQDFSSFPQTGDSFARIGAPAASVSADIAAIFARIGAPAGASLAVDVAAIFARIGAPAGASIAADLVTINAFVDTIEGRLPAALVGGRIDATVGAQQINLAITGNLKKNTAFTAFMFMMFDSITFAPKTGLGAAVVVSRSLDGAAFLGGTLSAVTEVGTGWYRCDWLAADMNGNEIAFRATAAACSDTNMKFETQP